ncbi:GT-D fold domain-containing protein [Paenibacillus guangzhouensis]|uniref:GT-D fold domain-containing protein n=1 Tax=Paenibacillus guangzhouensis TaxID=1473112 RepID=UPI001D12ADEE|nr:GT-D fold domain-containing glycosyltransferase [Paenibacillus guangzhouensis]
MTENEELPSVQEDDQKQGGHDGHSRSSYDRGFDAGYYEGGEGILAQMIPVFNVLPDIDVREVIRLGLGQVQHQLQPLVDPFTIYHEMQAAIESNQPMSLVRLGDGEMLTLAHDLVISTEQARADGPFLSYAGVNLPDHHGRTILADSIKRATIVGIPISRMRNFQGLLFPALRAHGIDYRDLRMTLSTINYLFYQLGYLALLLEGRRVLLVGNEAPALAPVLASRGISIIGIVTPVHGIRDVDRVIGEIAQHSFDIALVAAGIPAVIITERIATELGRVAIDFGHLADKIAKGQPI